MSIQFYRAEEHPYGVFSNYSAHAFYLDNKYYLTNEHYYQSQKVLDKDYQEIIRNANTPNKAKLLASLRIIKSTTYFWSYDINNKIKAAIEKGVTIRSDWEQVKEQVMIRGLKAKLDTHPSIRLLLSSTMSRMLIENSPIDWYWGCGKDNRGKNRLGVLLMEIRDKDDYFTITSEEEKQIQAIENKTTKNEYSQKNHT